LQEKTKEIAISCEKCTKEGINTIQNISNGEDERKKTVAITAIVSKLHENFQKEKQEWELLKTDLLKVIAIADEIKNEAMALAEAAVNDNLKLQSEVEELEARDVLSKSSSDVFEKRSRKPGREISERRCSSVPRMKKSDISDSEWGIDAGKYFVTTR